MIELCKCCRTLLKLLILFIPMVSYCAFVGGLMMMMMMIMMMMTTTTMKMTMMVMVRMMMTTMAMAISMALTMTMFSNQQCCIFAKLYGERILHTGPNTAKNSCAPAHRHVTAPSSRLARRHFSVDHFVRRTSVEYRMAKLKSVKMRLSERISIIFYYYQNEFN